MEKIKAVLHIHDKTEVPGDGAIGNMQNPSSSEPQGPTSTELWGSGNAGTIHHHDHKSNVVASAAQGSSKHHTYEGGPQPIAHADDPFTAAREAQRQAPPSSSEKGDEKALLAAELNQGSALPQEEKILSPIDDPTLHRSIDPFRHEAEPSAETGPGASHVHPDALMSASTGIATAPAGRGEAQTVPEGHTAFYDKVTGREGHELGK